jgi:hypothetical protein
VRCGVTTWAREGFYSLFGFGEGGVSSVSRVSTESYRAAERTVEALGEPTDVVVIID